MQLCSMKQGTVFQYIWTLSPLRVLQVFPTMSDILDYESCEHTANNALKMSSREGLKSMIHGAKLHRLD